MDLNEIEEIWITFKTKIGLKPKEKTFGMESVSIDTEENTINLFLSQEDTLSFMGMNILVQIRARMESNLAYASSIMEIKLEQILKDGVI